MTASNHRRSSDETRTEIIEKAMEVAAELGAMGFTLDAVAARTRFSKGALLYHFPTKAALLEGVMDQMGRVFVESVFAEAARDPQPYGRSARAYLRVTVNGPVTPKDISIGRAVLAACAIEPRLADKWRGYLSEVSRDDPEDPVGADDALMLRLLADGLWMSDLFGSHPVSPEQRNSLLSLLTPGHPITANDA